MSGRAEFLDQSLPEPKPSTFIQWKGTDVCMDFDCECGANLHFDGYFAYFPRCNQCGTVWQMPSILYPRKAPENQESSIEPE